MKSRINNVTFSFIILVLARIIYNTQWEIFILKKRQKTATNTFKCLNVYFYRIFLQGVPPIEVYRASIENEVGWHAFAIEKGSS
jgi:hypothetical protein